MVSAPQGRVALPDGLTFSGHEREPQWQLGEHPLSPARVGRRSRGCVAGRNAATGIRTARLARHQPRGRAPHPLRSERLREGKHRAIRALLPVPCKKHWRRRSFQCWILHGTGTATQRCQCARTRMRGLRLLRAKRTQCHSRTTDRIHAPMDQWHTGQQTVK